MLVDRCVKVLAERGVDHTGSFARVRGEHSFGRLKDDCGA